MNPSKNEESHGNEWAGGWIGVGARSDPRGSLAQSPGDCVV